MARLFLVDSLAAALLKLTVGCGVEGWGGGCCSEEESALLLPGPLDAGAGVRGADDARVASLRRSPPAPAPAPAPAAV
jgi:hypothetical protein